MIVIAAGGGSVPVYRTRGRLRGIDAVVDKDLASAVLAKDIGAALLLLVTDVRKVALNYLTPDQAELDTLSIAQATHHLAAGQFPAGSMGPKVQASIDFVQASGQKAIITTPEALGPAMQGRDGTHITP